MLRNELEEIKREHPDGLNVQAGSCRFCGQMAQIETLFPWPQEKLDEAATEMCKCGEAQNYTSRKKTGGKSEAHDRKAVWEISSRNRCRAFKNRCGFGRRRSD